MHATPRPPSKQTKNTTLTHEGLWSTGCQPAGWAGPWVGRQALPATPSLISCSRDSTTEVIGWSAPTPSHPRRGTPSSVKPVTRCQNSRTARMLPASTRVGSSVPPCPYYHRMTAFKPTRARSIAVRPLGPRHPIHIAGDPRRRRSKPHTGPGDGHGRVGLDLPNHCLCDRTVVPHAVVKHICILRSRTRSKPPPTKLQ
jgi:hypothetical protein